MRYINKFGWWLVRASNTQDLIVARCESYKKKDLEKIKNDLRFNLKKCNFKTPAF